MPAAPRNPVVYATGPDASVNSLALKLSGIDKDFQATAGGKIEKDPTTGEPTGILRSASRYLKYSSHQPQADASRTRRPPAKADRRLQLGRHHGIIDRDASPAAIEQWSRLRDAGQLHVRVAISHDVESTDKIDAHRG